MGYSIAFFVLAIILYKKSQISSLEKYFFGFLFFIYFVSYIAFWVADSLSGNGIDDSVIYHLKYGLGGTGFADFQSLMIWSILFVVLGLIASYFIAFKEIIYIEKVNKKILPFSLLLLLVSGIYNPTFKALSDIYSKPPEFNLSEADINDFGKYYRDPYIKKNGEIKNLVFIYTEGVEQTYFDESIFPGLVPNLKELQKESIYFSNIKSTEGTKFTIGGIVASQCGVPLVAPSHLNAFENSDTFLPRIKCLGDLLKEQGYFLSFFGGADPAFAGKGKFLYTHSFDEIWGRDNLKQKIEEESYLSAWGLYDDSLLPLARERFQELSEGDEPFALFVLTLDAHHPEGNPSVSCQDSPYQDGKSSILNAVHCTDNLVSNFIEEIKNSPYREDTLIIVASDHLALKSEATEILDKSKKERSNLFMIFSPDIFQEAENKMLGSTLDIGPTLLPYLGFEGEIGLGRNLLASDYKEEEVSFIQQNLRAWDKVYELFWDFPVLASDIEIVSSSEPYLIVNKRKFGIPVMLKFNKDLETSFIFKQKEEKMINEDEEYSIFEEELSKLGDSEAFIMVDFCQEIRGIDNSLPEIGVCYILGNKVNFESGLVSSNIKIKKENILLNLQPNE